MKLQTRDKATTVELDSNGLDVTLSINGITVTIPNELENDVIYFILGGTCPLCREEINQDKQVCCDCLDKVYAYHQNHHLCQRPLQK